jgi:hypothetical protein
MLKTSQSMHLTCANARFPTRAHLTSAFSLYTAHLPHARLPAHAHQASNFIKKRGEKLVIWLGIIVSPEFMQAAKGSEKIIAKFLWQGAYEKEGIKLTSRVKQGGKGVTQVCSWPSHSHCVDGQRMPTVLMTNARPLFLLTVLQI